MGLFNLFKKQKQMSNFDSQFFLGKKLGEGAFATVHEAIRKQDSQKFAVKILQKTKIKDGSMFNSVDAVINEIDILRRIHHKNIVALENIYNTDEHYYLVMYLATGGELFERILAKGSYTEQDAAALISQVLDAINYLHEMNIVHRDLKPENLLFRNPDEHADLMITDFGLSKSLDNSDFLNTTVGSPHYVAPEVLLGTGHGKPVDIWAIGVIAFVLLCGYTPFWGGENNSNEIMYQQICSGKFEFEHEYWQYISDAAKEFITMCLTVDPNSRLTSKDALAHSWLRTKATVDLLPTVRKNFNARRTFKKGFFVNLAAMAIATMNKLRKDASRLSINQPIGVPGLSTPQTDNGRLSVNK